jgi:hypothetical protein
MDHFDEHPIDRSAVIADDQLIERIAAGEDTAADNVAQLLTAWVAEVRL